MVFRLTGKSWALAVEGCGQAGRGNHCTGFAQVVVQATSRVGRLAQFDQPAIAGHCEGRLQRLSFVTDKQSLPASSASEQYYLALLGEAYKTRN